MYIFSETQMCANVSYICVTIIFIFLLNFSSHLGKEYFTKIILFKYKIKIIS